MKSHFLLPVVALCVFAFSSCDEKASTISFESDVKAFDTSYVAAIEPAEAHRVYIEEFTGVTCPNCPIGHTILKGFEDQNTGRVIVLGIHPNGQNQANPKPGHTQEDFRTVDGTELLNNFFGGLPFLPAAAIDRSPFGSNKLLEDRNSWPAKFDERKAVASPINLSVSSEYRTATHDAVIKVRVAFTGQVTKNIVLNLAVTESNLIDFQEFPTSEDDNYVHRHILRDIITPVTGAALLNGVAKQPGLVFERTFLYPVSDKWDPANCKIVASVSVDEQSDKTVLQAAEAELE